MILELLQLFDQGARDLLTAGDTQQGQDLPQVDNNALSALAPRILVEL